MGYKKTIIYKTQATVNCHNMWVTIVIHGHWATKKQPLKYAGNKQATLTIGLGNKFQ